MFKIATLFIGLCCLPAFTMAEDPIPPCMALQGVAVPLKKLFHNDFPETKMELINRNELTFSFDTHPFMVHSGSMTGEFSRQAHSEVGPTSKGFLLRLSCAPSDQAAQALTPQTLTRPYWQTYINQYPFKKTDTKVLLSYDFGSRTGQKLLEEIKAIVSSFCLVKKKA